MPLDGPGKHLKIFIGESDRWEHQPLADAILEMLRAEGLAGATVSRGLAGFGAHSRIHTAHVLRLSEDLPIVIDVIDRADQIEKVMPRLNEMIQEGLAVITDVEVLSTVTDPDGCDLGRTPEEATPERTGLGSIREYPADEMISMAS